MSESREVDLVRLAQQRGLRLGASRKQVMHVIDGMERPFTASDLLDAVEQKARGVGRATVFRTLQLLCNSGLLEQVRLEDGQLVYVTDHSEDHHHHLICTNCDTIVEIDDCEVGSLAKAIAKERGFKPRSHTFDIYGICAACHEN